jgi:hypothetical protein
MKPLPVQRGNDAIQPLASAPAIPGVRSTSFSASNRRTAANPAYRAYPWLLSLSTLMAAVFCLLYITKPVIIASPDGTSVKTTVSPLAATDKRPNDSPAGLMPVNDRLPGDTSPATEATTKSTSATSKTLPPPPVRSNLEETNLRIQHVLTAEAPGGHMDRIDIDVPVLYQSRNLRWTPAECDEARALMTRLMDYQDKSLQLRTEGSEILEAWNRLIGKSVPAGDLRADSPTLPANQQDNADAPRPAGLITTESIQLKSPGK